MAALDRAFLAHLSMSIQTVERYCRFEDWRQTNQAVVIDLNERRAPIERDTIKNDLHLAAADDAEQVVGDRQQIYDEGLQNVRATAEVVHVTR